MLKYFFVYMLCFALQNQALANNVNSPDGTSLTGAIQGDTLQEGRLQEAPFEIEPIEQETTQRDIQIQSCVAQGKAESDHCSQLLASTTLEPILKARLLSLLALKDPQNSNLVTRALNWGKEDLVVQVNLANLNLNQGQFETAAITYQQLLNQIGDSPLRTTVQHNLSIALRALGRHEEAKNLWQLLAQPTIVGTEDLGSELQ